MGSWMRSSGGKQETRGPKGLKEVHLSQITFMEKPSRFEREEGTEKSSWWQQTLHWAEIGALAALALFAGAETSGAQESGQQNYAEQIQRDVEKARNRERSIIEVVNAKGQEGKIGQIPIRRIILGDRTEVTIGYGENRRPIWLIEENPDASFRRMDYGVDGSIDRVVMNKSSNPKFAKNGSNDLNSFVPLEQLAEQASTEADLLPEAVKVFEVNHSDQRIRSVDFESGKSGELSGSEAERLIAKLQAGFAVKLADIEQALK